MRPSADPGTPTPGVPYPARSRSRRRPVADTGPVADAVRSPHAARSPRRCRSRRRTRSPPPEPYPVAIRMWLSPPARRVAALDGRDRLLEVSELFAGSGRRGASRAPAGRPRPARTSLRANWSTCQASSGACEPAGVAASARPRDRAATASSWSLVAEAMASSRSVSPARLRRVARVLVTEVARTRWARRPAGLTRTAAVEPIRVSSRAARSGTSRVPPTIDGRHGRRWRSGAGPASAEHVGRRPARAAVARKRRKAEAGTRGWGSCGRRLASLARPTGSQGSSQSCAAPVRAEPWVGPPLAQRSDDHRR